MRIVTVFILFFTTILNAQLSGDWHLDELGDDSYSYYLNDEVTENSDGVAFSTNSTGNSGGKLCSALDFTPSSTEDYATLDENSINGASDVTISVWLKTTSHDGRALLSGARSDSDNALLLWFSSDTTFSVYIDGASVGYTIPDIVDGTWHHFVWRREGTQGCVIIDGDSANKICKSVSGAAFNIESLVLGQDQDNVGGGFNSGQDWEGYVDELLIFNSALSDSEVADIYSNENSGKNYDGTQRVCKTEQAVDISKDNNYADYHFDELGYTGANGEVKDSHWGKDGLSHSVQTVAGKLCQALDLRANGTSDYVTLPNEVLSGITNFTIAVWHKGESGDDSNALISGARSSQANELLWWFTNPTKFTPHINGSYKYIASPNIDDGTWHHLVWRQNGAEACYYFDGVKQGCATFDNIRQLSIESLIIGQEQDSVGGSFDASQDWEGLLDEMLIFRRDLSDSEIQTGYNNQKNGKNWDGTSRMCPYPKISKISCIINDPVNATTNPKRIPGATIRYAIEVHNPNSATLNSVVVDDDISSSYDLSTIANLKIDGSNSCNCLNPTAAGANGSDGGISGNKVKLDFLDVSGGATECGYFEVQIK